MKAKILVVATANTPFLIDRVKMSCESEHEIYWFTASKECPSHFCKTFHLQLKPFLGPLNRLISTFYFLWVYLRVRPDILHVHWAVFPVALVTFPKKLIVSTMGSDINSDAYAGIKKKLVGLLLRKADIITVKSAVMAKTVSSYGVNSSSIKEITWGIDQTFFERFKSEPSQKKTMTFFSPRSIKPLYRIPAIVEAFAKFHSELPNSKLVLAQMHQFPEEYQKIKEIISQYEIEDAISFLGTLSKNQMIEALEQSDAVVSYAEVDGMPQTLYEAMAIGCYPIFTNLSNYDSLLSHQKNAYLCSDEEELYKGFTYTYDLWENDRLSTILTENHNLSFSIANKTEQTLELHKLYKI